MGSRLQGLGLVGWNKHTSSSGSDEASISHSSQAKCKETGEKSSLRRRVLGCGGWSWYPIDSKGRALCFGRPGSELVVVE